MDILRGIALAATGDLTQAEKIYRKLVTSDFGILSKKFSMILYLFLSKRLKVNIHKKTEMFSALIKDTAFYRLSSLM